MSDPAVVIDISIYRFHMQFLPIFPESLRVPVGADMLVIADHPDLVAIPPAGIPYIIIAAEEMPVIKQQTLHPGVVFITLHRCPDDGIIVLMDDFVSLEINTPVSIGRHFVEGLIGLGRQYGTSFLQAIVPDGITDL